MRIWGSESGNDAHVCYKDVEKKIVEEIAFRLDASDPSLDLIRMICRLAAQLSCFLLTADSEILQPVESVVLTAIRNSAAAKFVNDPVCDSRSMHVRLVQHSSSPSMNSE